MKTMKGTTPKRFIIILSIMAAIIAAIVVIFFLFTHHAPVKTEPGYVTGTVSRVHMTQTITASGKVTSGKSEKVKFAKGKVFKVLAAEQNELVQKGQPVVYYSDGTHTDAPVSGVVKSVHAPKSGAASGESYYFRLDNTEDLYLKVMIPEDKINEVARGNPADIVINAYEDRDYTGKIISIQGESSSMRSSDQEEAESVEAEEDADTEEDDGDAEETDEDAYDDDDSDDSDSYDDEEGSEGTAYYAIHIAFENDGDIRPGMSASAVITISDRNDVLAVPVQAVRFNKQHTPYVEKIDGKDVSKVKVEIGESDPMYVEIKSGLMNGDTIRMRKY